MASFMIDPNDLGLWPPNHIPGDFANVAALPVIGNLRNGTQAHLSDGTPYYWNRRNQVWTAVGQSVAATDTSSRPPALTDNATAGYSTSSLWQYNGDLYQPVYSGTDCAVWARLNESQGGSAVDIVGAGNTVFAGGTIAMLADYTGAAVDVAVTVGGVYQISTINMLATGELDNVALGAAIAKADANTLVYVAKIYDQSGAGNHAALGTAAGVPAVLSGTIATNQLTATVTTGAVAVGQYVFGNGVTAGSKINSGSASPWTLNSNSTVGSATTFVLGTHLPPYIDFDTLLNRYVIYSPNDLNGHSLQFPQTMTIAAANNLGVYALGRGTVTSNGANTVLCTVGDQGISPTNNFLITGGSSGNTQVRLTTYLNGATALPMNICIDSQPMVLVLSSAAAGVAANINGNAGTSVARSATALAGGWLFGPYPSTNLNAGMMQLVGLAIFSAAPTANQQSSLLNAGMVRINAYPQVKNQVFLLGDSRFANTKITNAGGVATELPKYIGRNFRVTCAALAGDTAVNQIGDGLVPTSTGVAFYLSAVKQAGANYAVILLGVNDLGNGASVAAVVATLKTYCAQLTAVGITPILISELATNNTPGNENTLLPLLAAAINTAGASGMGAAAIVNLQGYSPVLATGTAAYYYDGLHPTAALHQLIASAITPLI